MTRQILLGTAAALLIAVPVSALTMTTIRDSRATFVMAEAGENSQQFLELTPSPIIADFNSSLQAHAMEFSESNLPGGSDIYGLGSSAWADTGQDSTIGVLSISGSGFANASGNHGSSVPLGDTDALTDDGRFLATASSGMFVSFEIDEAANYDINAFISVGTDLAIGGQGNSGLNAAVVRLLNSDLQVIFIKELQNGKESVNESGMLEPGIYTFSILALAQVYSTHLDDANGEHVLIDNDYARSASFKGGLTLTSKDQPIPEPVTTSLVGMSLGALVLRTSRRRRA